MHPLLSSFLILGACGGATGTADVPATPPSEQAKKLVLPTDPGEAKSVVSAKIDGPADAVVVLGRIRAIVEDRVAFTLMDTELVYCGEKNKEDNCKTPWDYCCESGKTITANSLAVEARGADGKPIPTPTLPDLRLLDVVKVTGKMVVDEHGNHMLLATGLFRMERPQLPDYVHWPQ